jgi:hypothetical protein
VASSWAQGLPRWKPHIAGGKVYSLDHLNPRRLTLDFAARADLPAISVEIRVGFMSHTFTEACASGEPAHPEYSRPNDPRIFSQRRHEFSRHLPALLDTIGTRRCHVSNSGHGNHFVIEGLPGLQPGEEYWVFLQMECVERTVARMRIRSAYAGRRDQAPHARGRQSMMFRELMARTLGLKETRVTPQRQTPPRGRGS